MISTFKKMVRAWFQRFSVSSELIYRRSSYSQEGEDRLLDRYFEYRGPGFYVDIGAHHPHRFSNTYLFYMRGWRGINIDAMPGSMKLFRHMRKRDINLEVGVGLESAVAKFFVFNEPALNTFDEKTARSYTQPERRLEKTVDVQIEPLSTILARHVPAYTEIDFFSIDVEGRDLDVLRSNDWTRFRPKYILVECFGKDLQGLQQNATVQFLTTVGYVACAKTVNTFFFVREDSGEIASGVRTGG